MITPAGSKLEGPRKETLRQQLQALGFDEVRFAALAAGEASLRDWLAAGYHADMAWMESTAEKRIHPELVLSGARAVIILGVNYGPGHPANHVRREGDRPQWARYSLHVDYHDTIKSGLIAAGRLLEQEWGVTGTDYRAYVDTGPVLERGWAARSGLGFRGKNAMLISRRHGNWLFLASILVRREIEPDAPLRKKALPDTAAEPVGLLCGKCTRCLVACPTQAFPQPGVVDARRCISYQTIENKGTIPRELRAGIGTRIFGCDVCLEVCPWNRFAQQGRRVLLSVRHDIAELDLLEILALTPARFSELFRGTAVQRLKLNGLLRNACVVAGNSGDPVLLPAVFRLVTHQASVVRAHAIWAVRRLGGTGAEAMLAPVRAKETDATVLAEYEAAG